MSLKAQRKRLWLIPGQLVAKGTKKQSEAETWAVCRQGQKRKRMRLILGQVLAKGTKKEREGFWGRGGEFLGSCSTRVLTTEALYFQRSYFCLECMDHTPGICFLVHLVTEVWLVPMQSRTPTWQMPPKSYLILMTPRIPAKTPPMTLARGHVTQNFS